MVARRLVLASTWTLAVLLAPMTALAQDPCAEPAARALVLGSGGSKGAFQAGAVYHLVVHRGCDFTEISGTSVGALNGALLAQAPRSDDPEVSLAQLRAAAEGLVEEWGGLTTSRAVMRSRPLGKVRFALFGLDSVENFEPLHEFVREHVELDRLAAGRELRIGTMSLNDGRYREIVLNGDGRVDRASAHDFIAGSAIVPVFGRLPVITPPEGGAGLQFGDGGIRHATPIRSYFQACDGGGACMPLTGANTPPHPPIEQIFVVVTSPYARYDDTRPVFDPKAIDARSGRIEDGRRILVRVVDLLVDTLYRDDLDDVLIYNEVLGALDAASAEPPFPLGSFNRVGRVSKPYEIAIVAPQREESDPMSIFDVSPQKLHREMYCGCLAADEGLRVQYGVASQAERCAERFPAVPGNRRRPFVAHEPAVCRADTGEPRP
jgi:NTE family protein